VLFSINRDGYVQVNQEFYNGNVVKANLRAITEFGEPINRPIILEDKPRVCDFNKVFDASGKCSSCPSYYVADAIFVSCIRPTCLFNEKLAKEGSCERCP